MSKFEIAIAFRTRFRVWKHGNGQAGAQGHQFKLNKENSNVP